MVTMNERCPDCRTLWTHCPHCNADFCNDCGMMADDVTIEDDDDDATNDSSALDYPRRL